MSGRRIELPDPERRDALLAQWAAAVNAALDEAYRGLGSLGLLHDSPARKRYRRELQRSRLRLREGWIPVGWSTEADAVVALAPKRDARPYRFACPHCGLTYKANQYAYMRRHHEKHEGVR